MAQENLKTVKEDNFIIVALVQYLMWFKTCFVHKSDLTMFI